MSLNPIQLKHKLTRPDMCRQSACAWAAAFAQEHGLAGLRETVGGDYPAGSGAHDDVVNSKY
jgi:hypothetical protein